MSSSLEAKNVESPGLPDRRSWACRILAVGILLAVAAGHVLYLQAEVVGLAEDEAYYWDWSRQLDIGFYSKGPLTALLIRGGCELFGDTMLGVRIPAVALRAGLALCLYWLTRRLFRSDPLALGAMLLGYAVPIMLAGGLVMTPDAPFLFLWALALCLGVLAGMEGRRWAFLAAGVVVGIGFLAKFAMPLWFAGLGLFLLLDPLSRPMLRRRWPWLAVLVAMPFALPVLLWNTRHNLVTLRHVSEDLGLTGDTSFVLGNVADFWTGQLLLAGPLFFLVMMAAAGYALRRPVRQAGHRITDHPERRSMLYLACMSLPLFAGVLATSFRTHPAANWTAACYVGLVVLTAYFISVKMADRIAWRRWRLLFYPALLVNLGLIAAAHQTQLLYPAVVTANDRFPDLHLTARVDPTLRLHGWKEAAGQVAEQLSQLPEGSLVLAADYQTTAIMAFYLPGRPKTYCAGAYFARREQREPFSQYDIWPDRRLDRERIGKLELAGRDAIYVGPLTGDLRKAFSRVEELPDIVVMRGGLEVRRLEVHRCHEFHGFVWPGWEGRYHR